MSAGVHKYLRTGYSMVRLSPLRLHALRILATIISMESMRLNGEIEGNFKSSAYCIPPAPLDSL